MKEPLSVVFPSLFALTTNKEALVATCGSLQGRRGVVKNFLLVIQGKRIIPNQKNMLFMKEVKDDHFWVKHFYMS